MRPDHRDLVSAVLLGAELGILDKLDRIVLMIFVSQDLPGTIDLPDCAALPVQCLAHRFQHAGGRLFERRRFGQRLGRLEQHPLVRLGGAAFAVLSRALVHQFTSPNTEGQHYTTGSRIPSERYAMAQSPQHSILLVDDDRGLRHVLSALLQEAGHRVESAGDGPEALEMLGQGSSFDLVLLDIGLPSMSGLDVLARVRELPSPPLVIVMTADDTSATLLEAVRRQAYRYLRKPFPPNAIVEVVNEAAAPTAALSIEVISAKPEWLELVAPCTLEMADRIQSFVMHLEANLSEAVREAVAQAFRELLTNAIEWGGKLDPNRTVRIACVRTPRMLLYRIADPGEGFDIDKLRHAAIMNPDDDPMHHLSVREAQGLRPGGFGLAMTLSLVDDLIYNEARNEVLLIKYLDDGGDK